MLLPRQLKSLRVSTWRQHQSFADRIKNKYLLPGNYPFKPLYLIWRLENHAASPIAARPATINLKLLMEQIRSISSLKEDRLSHLPVAITGKSGIQALSSSNHKIISEQGYQKRLNSTSGKMMNFNTDVLQQEYGRAAKLNRSAWPPHAVQSYPSLNSGHRRELGLSPGNRIYRMRTYLEPSRHDRISPSEKLALKPNSTNNLPGTGTLNLSLTIPVRTGQTMQKPKREGSVLGGGGVLNAGEKPARMNAPAVKRISLGQRRIIQLSRKGSVSADNYSRWFPTQSKPIEPMLPHINSGIIFPKVRYGPIPSSVAGVHRAYVFNKFSQLNDLMTGLSPAKELELNGSFPLTPDGGAASLGQSLVFNILKATKTLPGQAGHRYLNNYIKRQHQIIRQKETALDQVKQRLSTLSTRLLISGKNELEQSKQRLSLLPARSQISEKIALDQVKQQQMLAAPSGSLKAGNKAQNRIGATRLNSYSVSHLLYFNDSGRPGASKSRSEQQWDDNRSYAQEKGKPYLNSVPGYYDGNLRIIALPYLQTRFIDNLYKQQPGYFRNGIGANRSTANIYLDGASSSFYPALPVAAGSGAREVMLPWQNRVRTIERNLRGSSTINRKLISETSKLVQVARHEKLASGTRGQIGVSDKLAGGYPDSGYLPARSHILLIIKRMLSHIHSTVGQTRLLNPEWFGEKQHKDELRRDYKQGLKFQIVGRTISETLKGQPAFEQINNKHLALLKSPVPGWSKPSFADFIYYKTAMVDAAKDAKKMRGHDDAANSQLRQLEIRAMDNVTGRTSSRRADQVISRLRKPGKLSRYSEYADQKIHPGGRSVRNRLLAKLLSSSVGAINKINQAFPNIFRSTLMTDSGKNNLSFLPSDRPDIIMLQTNAGNVNELLAMPKIYRKFDYDQGRTKQGALNFANQSTGRSIFESRQFMDKQPKNYQQKQIKSDSWPKLFGKNPGFIREHLNSLKKRIDLREPKSGLITYKKTKRYHQKIFKYDSLPEWFINKNSGLAMFPNIPDNFSELTNNWRSQRAVSNLATNQGLIVKEPTQILARAAKLLPFNHLAKSRQGAYWNRQSNRYSATRPVNKDKLDNHRRGVLRTLVTGPAVSGNGKILTALKMIWGAAGSNILRSASNIAGNVSALKPERWLNRYAKQSRVNGIQPRAEISNIKRTPQTGWGRISKGENQSLIAGNKAGLPVNTWDPNLIPYRGIKTEDDKRLQPSSQLASRPNLNYRQDTSTAARSKTDSAIESQAASINTELKMQMAGARNAELKASEIKTIADRVYREIQQRMKSERQRRGM